MEGSPRVPSSQAALWLHGISGRRHYDGPRAGRDAAARLAATHLGFVVSNRGNSTSAPPSFTFRIALEGLPSSGPAPVFTGHAYAPNATDAPLGQVAAVLDSYGHWALEVPVPQLTLQFWLQQ